jgi:anti-sigma B factor antagonist
MELLVTDLNDRVAKVRLTGRLDSPGVDKIEAKFLAVTQAPGKDALVDLSGVTFISSMGIRMLISAARALSRRQAKLVLFAPQAMVGEVLNHAALSDVIPIASDERAAIALTGA